MDNAQKIDEQLAALAAYLTARREAIMQAWRKAVERDPEMMTGASLPRAQLNDHVPELLDAYGEKLLVVTGRQLRAFEKTHKDDAAAHGLQRWQQGYDLREVSREWGRLQLCMADELEGYATAHPELDDGVMSTARRAWIEICTEGASESTSQYFHLQQIEAMGHVRDLEQAMEQVQTLEQQRGALLLEGLHLLHCLFQVTHVAHGFDLLQVEILRRAFAGTFGADLDPRTPGGGHHAFVELGVRRRVAFQLVGHAQLQPAPLPAHFAQVVALLPALQAVRGRVVLVRFLERAQLPAGDDQQFFAVGVQQLGDVIVQLRTRQRGACHHFRIAFDGLAPCLHDRFAARSQVGGQRRQLLVDLLRVVHCLRPPAAVGFRGEPPGCNCTDSAPRLCGRAARER